MERTKAMEITLNHTIIPAYNNIDTAKFYERVFGFKFIKEWGPFAVLKVNETLTFDFRTEKGFLSLHYAFKVSEEQFDQILARIKLEKLPIGSGPGTLDDGEINTNFNGRGVYFKDPNGHILEILTTDYVLN